MTDTDEGRHFDFCGLARELRDTIYDDLLNESTLLHTGDDLSGFSFLAQGLVDTNFLLVSRSFHDELKERAEKQLHVTIQDHGEDVSYLRRARSPPLLLRVRSLTLQLWLDCSGRDEIANSRACRIIESELESLREVVETMVRLTPRLERLRIDVHCPGHRNHAMCRPTLAKRVGSILSVTKAVELWVYEIPAELLAIAETPTDPALLMRPKSAHYENRTGPFARWNQATQALEDVDCAYEEQTAEGSEG
ncbi:hypothetical protein KC345_g4887 [Hortaea werneckii]|nr:hypothetical protein KC345_g4887 [Hortaea werneckii]